jgi:alpha-tubulin suppressor-like RCC1 family protein
VVAVPFVQLAAPAPASAATTAVWSWGDDSLGQLGDGGTATGRLRPALGPQLTDVVQVAGGRGHVLALRAGGTVVAWGQNDFGQVGDGTTTNRSAPVATTTRSPSTRPARCGRGATTPSGSSGSATVRRARWRRASPG